MLASSQCLIAQPHDRFPNGRCTMRPTSIDIPNVAGFTSVESGSSENRLPRGAPLQLTTMLAEARTPAHPARKWNLRRHPQGYGR